MNEYLLKMLSLQKDIEKNSKKQTLVKSISALCVFMVFFCSFNPEKLMNIAFIVSIPVIIMLFVIDSSFAYKSHSLEVDIYLLELEHLKKEKEAEAAEGKAISDNWIDSIVKPDDKPSLSIIYFFILIAIDVAIWLL